MSAAASDLLTSPTKVKETLTTLRAWQKRDADDLIETERDLSDVRAYLTLSQKVTVALESLSRQLFRELLNVIEEKLSIALQEVLEQPIRLKADVQWRRN